MEETEIIKNVLAAAPADSKIFISKLGDIAERVEQILADKGWSQSDLAQAMGKHESEISKWLTSIHNFTLKSISKMEAALGADIIQIPLSGEIQSQTRYVYLTVKAGSNNTSADLFDAAAITESIKPGNMKEFITKAVSNQYSPVFDQDLIEETIREEEPIPLAI